MRKTEIIKELNFLDDIDALEDEYIAKYGISAFNISNWNSSQEFKSKIIKDLSMQNDFDCLDYIFSYEQSEQKGSVVLSKLGYSENKATLFTHSGSSSIINVINLLKKIGIKKLIVLCPVYFTVIHCCEMFGLDYELIYINRDVNYIFNKNEFVGIGDVSFAYWITNPIYCTSVYYTSNQIEFFKTICQTNYVVFDESLCLLEYLITPKINSKYVIGLISPHKSICMNGTKFSLVTTDIRFQNFLDAWSDVLCGCLCCSNEIAIKHFLSDSYIAYKKVFDKTIKKQFME